MFRSQALFTALLCLLAPAALADETARPYPPPAEVKAKLLSQLDRPRVPLDPQIQLVEPADKDLMLNG
jgi:hypothetical protein